MRRNLLILTWVVFGILFSFSQSWAQCPEDPNDLGECDTLYLETFCGDILFSLPRPNFIRVPIYVTHDLNYGMQPPFDDKEDSLNAFTIPLCYTHTNAAKYCSVSNHWNNTNLVGPTIDRSIFRHLVCGNDTTYNWQMDRKEEGLGEGLHLCRQGRRGGRDGQATRRTFRGR